MNTLQGIASMLFISGAAALLGAGCAATEEPVNAGIDNDTEEEATVGSVQEEQRRRPPRGGPRYGGGGGGGNPCAWLEDGAYCGGNQIPGNPNTLYRCRYGYQSVIQHCIYGCQRMPQGIPDRCY
jgi:hypothetical protein